MEEKKRDHDAKMEKMETEMEQVFEMKVKEKKKQKLRDSESDVSTLLLLMALSSFEMNSSYSTSCCFIASTAPRADAKVP